MMNDELITRTAVMESLTAEYNRRGTGDGLKLAWIEKAVSDTPSAELATNLQQTCNLASDLISRQTVLDIVDDLRDRMTVEGYWSMVERVKALPSAQQETAKRIVGKSRDGMTLWYQCDMCNEPVDAQDVFCRGCGRRLTDG